MRVCATCVHFFYSPGTRGFSEWTPGDAGYMACEKDHWEMDPLYEFTEEQYCGRMKMAMECQDYEENEPE